MYTNSVLGKARSGHVLSQYKYFKKTTCLVPETYLVLVEMSGWTKTDGFLIASLLTSFVDSSIGVISGQEMFS